MCIPILTLLRKYNIWLVKGMPVEQAEKIVGDNKDLEISINGDDVKISSRGPIQNLKLNQETTSTGPDGKVFNVSR